MTTALSSPVRGGVLLLSAAMLLLAGACCPDRTEIQTDDPQLAGYLELVMPSKVRILEWTKPISIIGDGNADGVEVILEARDSFDDLTKVVGTFHFELQTRPISGPMGTRVAFWPVEMSTQKAQLMYRDKLSRFYHFPLQLEGQQLKPGRYVLSVWLLLPTEARLFDEYQFEYDGKPAPGPSAF
jgi:hypothetical protein